MGDRCGAYLGAAAEALDLAGSARVEERWSDASALVGMTVGALAAHLVSQVTGVLAALDHPVDGTPLTLDEHYARVAWRWSGPDDQANASIRGSGEVSAARGSTALQADGRATLVILTERLPVLPAERPVQPPWLAWPLSLEDFLLVRLMEIAVHSDDLAASVGVPTPEQPPEVLEPVLALLARLSVERHGQPAVLRALTRSERAHGTISAF
ncbi:MAG: maleylpyruvate isomerase N-terminal domain-containing protein [Nocardioides sp.]